MGKCPQGLKPDAFQNANAALKRRSSTWGFESLDWAPAGAEARVWLEADGTTEVVPFPQSVCETENSGKRFEVGSPLKLPQPQFCVKEPTFRSVFSVKERWPSGPVEGFFREIYEQISHDRAVRNDKRWEG